MSLSEAAKDIFDRQLAGAKAGERDFRARAWADYHRLGLPDRKNEAWKYSGLTALAGGVWSRAAEVVEAPPAVISWRERHRADFDIVVLVNGRFNAKASLLSPELRAAMAPPSYNLPDFADDGFSSLAAAVAEPGFALRITGVLPRPVLLLRAHTGQGAWTASYSEMHLGAGAQARVAEIFLGEAEYLRTELTRVELARGARLDWLRLQDEGASASHYADARARVESGAILQFNQLHMGAIWARTSVRVDLRGPEAEAAVNGISFGGGDQHIDQRILVHHQSGRTRSSQLCKGVLKDKARGIVNGKIHIAADAQKVASSQLNHALLLSRAAEADIKPELEIYADDVKANHGASIGRMDRDKLFYLESRGIPAAEARQMLARAFVSDVLMKIEAEPLRALAGECLSRRLPEFLAEMQT